MFISFPKAIDHGSIRRPLPRNVPTLLCVHPRPWQVPVCEDSPPRAPLTLYSRGGNLAKPIDGSFEC